MTTTTWGAPATVDVPAPPPPRFTLPDTILVIDDASGHWQMGTTYTPEVCGYSRSIASACSEFGNGDVLDDTVAASVDAARTVTLDLASVPFDGTYNIDWGDGHIGTWTKPSANPTHTYPAGVATSYPITVTGIPGGPTGGYKSTMTVNVTTGATSGPFQGTSTLGIVKESQDGVPFVDGVPFNSYHLAKCRTVGTIGDAKRRALRGLEATEHIAVEEAAARIVLGSPDFQTVTPVGAPAAGADIADGLAEVEWNLRAQYGLQGTIFMTAETAVQLSSRGMLQESGGKLTTILGTPVAAFSVLVAGPPGNESGPGSSWILGVGNPVLRRGRPLVPDPAIDMSNEFIVLAERPWSFSFECIAVGAEVVSKSCCGTAAVASDPQSGGGETVDTGTDTVIGPGGNWTPPAGSLRNVSIVVTAGSVEINGDEVTAPNTVNFDADPGETLTPPTVTANSTGDIAVVAWVVNP